MAFNVNKWDFEAAIRIYASGLSLRHDKTIAGIDDPAFINERLLGFWPGCPQAEVAALRWGDKTKIAVPLKIMRVENMGINQHAGIWETADFDLAFLRVFGQCT